MRLSIIARPYKVGLVGFWELIPSALGWLAPGITPCAKTPAFNLRVESSSRFGQSENQKYWRRLLEEANRENGSTLSWPAHVFTRPGPISVIAQRPSARFRGRGSGGS